MSNTHEPPENGRGAEGAESDPSVEPGVRPNGQGAPSESPATPEMPPQYAPPQGDVPPQYAPPQAYGAPPQGEAPPYGAPGQQYAQPQYGAPEQQYAQPQYAPPPPYAQAGAGTNPGQPGAASQGYPGQPGQGPYGAPQGPREPRQPNMVGLIGFIVAIVGFVFACIPPVVWASWILLPAALVLGIVALCLKNKKKGLGIAALGISVVGFIVSIVVFFVSLAMVFGQVVSDTSNLPDISELEEEWGDALPDATEGDPGAPVDPADALALGESIDAGDWAYTVNAVDVDAVNEISAESSINGEPDAGMTFILVNITAEYTGSGSGAGMSAPPLLVSFVDEDGTRYTELQKTLIAPDDLITQGPAESEGTVTGNLALQVPADTAEQGVLAVDTSIADPNGGEHFVAVK